MKTPAAQRCRPNFSSNYTYITYSNKAYNAIRVAGLTGSSLTRVRTVQFIGGSYE